MCKENNIPVYQKNFTLFDVYGADECFITGTFAGITGVNEVDGRLIGDTKKTPMITRLKELYIAMIKNQVKK